MLFSRISSWWRRVSNTSEKVQFHKKYRYDAVGIQFYLQLCRQSKSWRVSWHLKSEYILNKKWQGEGHFQVVKNVSKADSESSPVCVEHGAWEGRR